MKKIIYTFCFFTSILIACKDGIGVNKAQKGLEEIGSVEIFDNALLEYIDPEAQVQILASGFENTDAPLWIESDDVLLFSDVSKNHIYKWSLENGVELMVSESGYTGNDKALNKYGVTGMALNHHRNVIMCQQGDRSLALWASTLHTPRSNFVKMAEKYKKQPFNSPHDLVIDSKGNIFFTDPAYGLPDGLQDANKSLAYQGIFRVSKNGNIKNLASSSLSYPDGIALSNDEKTLFVSNANPKNPSIYHFQLNEDASKMTDKTLFAELSSEEGLPSGMKMHSTGYLFVAVGNSVLVFDPKGSIAAKINCNHPVSNLAFSEGERFVYITASDKIMRLPIKKTL